MKNNQMKVPVYQPASWSYQQHAAAAARSAVVGSTKEHPCYNSHSPGFCADFGWGYTIRGMHISCVRKQHAQQPYYPSTYQHQKC